jgi:hypothetical protein
MESLLKRRRQTWPLLKGTLEPACRFSLHTLRAWCPGSKYQIISVLYGSYRHFMRSNSRVSKTRPKLCAVPSLFPQGTCVLQEEHMAPFSHQAPSNLRMKLMLIEWCTGSGSRIISKEVKMKRCLQQRAWLF